MKNKFGIKPYLALILTNIIWGASTPIFKWALQDIPPFTFAFVRFAMAGGLLFPFIFIKPIRLTFKQMALLCLGAFFGFTVSIGAVNLGVQLMDSSTWTLLSLMGPVIFFFISITFLKEEFHMRRLVGMCMSLLGVVVVVAGPLTTTGFVWGARMTEGLFLLGVVTMGGIAYTLLHRRVSARIEPVQLLALSFVFAAATFFPLALVEWRTWSFAQLTWPGIWGIWYSVIFTSLVAYFCYIYGITRIEAQEIGIFSYMSPVAAFAVAVPLLHEQPTIWVFIGGVIIFAGIYIAERRLHVVVKKHEHAVHRHV